MGAIRKLVSKLFKRGHGDFEDTMAEQHLLGYNLPKLG